MAAVPGFGVDPAAITAAADALRMKGRAVEETGRAIVDLWPTIATSYQAPETQQLVNAILPLGPCAVGSHQVSRDVADALTRFADQVDTVLQQIRSLVGTGAAEPDPETQTQLDRFTYEYAQYELECANAIRRAVGQGDVDLGLLTNTLAAPAAAPPEQDQLTDLLLDAGEEAVFLVLPATRLPRLVVQAARELHAIPDIPGLAELVGLKPGAPVPPPGPPLPVPVGELRLQNQITVDDLIAPDLAPLVGPVVAGQFVPSLIPHTRDAPLRQIVTVERNAEGNASALDAGPGGTFQPNTRFVVDNGKFIYETDSQGRVVHAEGELDEHFATDDQVRDDTAQNRAGKRGGRADDGGHLFAASLDGPGEAINLVPMSRRANRVDYRALEKVWDDAIVSQHEEVHVTVDIDYPPGATGADSLRPNQFRVESVTSAPPDPVTGDTSFDHQTYRPPVVITN